MFLHNTNMSFMSARGWIFVAMLASPLAFGSCNQQPVKSPSVNDMQQKMDSLQKKLDDAYKPGLGEMMTGMQLHHAKLWYAGVNDNWPLADFEIKELFETVADIQHYNKDRAEVKLIPMVTSVLTDLNNKIKQKDAVGFKSSFQLLTNTCNSCHMATGFDFNVITIPSGLPVTNQDFIPVKQ
jgi:hypothetical protein